VTQQPTAPRTTVDAVLSQAIAPAIDAIGQNDFWREELAVDFVHTKGESHFVHRLFHTLRARGVTCRLEDRRCDLVIRWGDPASGVEHPVKVEAKVIHALQLLSAKRIDRGFQVFEYKTKDLEALRHGDADILLAVVPRFLDGVHLKYPKQVGPHELSKFGFPDTSEGGAIAEVHRSFLDAATARAVQWADAKGLARPEQWELQLTSRPDSFVIDVVVFAFSRR